MDCYSVSALLTGGPKDSADQKSPLGRALVGESSNPVCVEREVTQDKNICGLMSRGRGLGWLVSSLEEKDWKICDMED